MLVDIEKIRFLRIRGYIYVMNRTGLEIIDNQYVIYRYINVCENYNKLLKS